MANILEAGPHDLASAIGRLGVHDHLCLIYETQEEQFAAVIPYVRLGLERGEKCIYVVDDNTAAMVVNGMKAAGIDVAAELESGRLVIANKQDAYLKQGFFDPDWMIDFLKHSTDEARAAGYAALRITGEMTWVLGGDPGSERLMEYEAKLNYFFPANDAQAICQYNRTRFSSEILRDVISTHPLVIYGGRVCRNFYYIPPDDLLAKHRPEREVDRLLANIINREKAEDDLRQYQEHLEARTAQLEAANKELESFAYSVSHDLRAPLRHIDGCLSLLKKRIAPALDEESQRYMATVSRAALRMAALIDDLLSFSRMRGVEMTMTQILLGDLVQEVVEESKHETPGRAVDWRVASLPVVTGDRSLLRMVLVNLISNALKYTKPRDRAEIEIGSLPGDKSETIIFVRDNGVGFDMKYVDKLFGIFQRLHGIDEFEGTGVGLAHVRRIIDRHGGRTWAEGKVDGGATFYFSLPRNPAGA